MGRADVKRFRARCRNLTVWPSVVRPTGSPSCPVKFSVSDIVHYRIRTPGLSASVTTTTHGWAERQCGTYEIVRNGDDLVL